MKHSPIIVKQSLNTSITNVWDAITDVKQMRQWYFDNLESFKPEVGFKTQFNIHHNGNDYLHQWEITEVIAPKKLICSWKFEGYSGNSFVIWNLSEENNVTTITLTCKGYETFPQDNPDFTRESCEAGWNYFICEQLKEYIEKTH